MAAMQPVERADGELVCIINTSHLQNTMRISHAAALPLPLVSCPLPLHNFKSICANLIRSFCLWFRFVYCFPCKPCSSLWLVARGCFDRSFKVPVFAETDKISLRLRCEFVYEEHSSLSPPPPPSLLLLSTTTTKIIQFHWVQLMCACEWVCLCVLRDTNDRNKFSFSLASCSKARSRVRFNIFTLKLNKK